MSLAGDSSGQAYGVNDVDVAGAIDISSELASASEFSGEPQKLRGLFADTSDSTGKPKGIRRTFDLEAPDRWQTFEGMSRILMGAKAGDRMYISAPLYHSTPTALAGFTMAAGNVDLFIDPKFDPEQFLAVVEEHKITHAYIVPTMMVRMLKLPQEVKEKYDVSSLRLSGTPRESSWLTFSRLQISLQMGHLNLCGTRVLAIPVIIAGGYFMSFFIQVLDATLEVLAQAGGGGGYGGSGSGGSATHDPPRPEVSGRTPAQLCNRANPTARSAIQAANFSATRRERLHHNSICLERAESG